MKLLILIMMILLYVFAGKVKTLSLLCQFDSWNTFKYSLFPAPGKYSCCYKSFGSDGCIEKKNDKEKHDPVIDEINKSIVFDKI